ncbi:MAG: sugar ABC transporter permease [Firmicutes bacterium]|nr:sugar ABC transporter permease [Bacillota bacterium]
MGSVKSVNSFKKFNKYKYLFLLLTPALILTFIFHYVPMYGIIIAFKDYKMIKGILGSDWAGFTHFQTMFTSPSFFEILRNTIIISLYRLIFGFPAPIILALMLNEIMHNKYKKIIQTISYLPHFMSWVVIGGILREVLSPQRGIVNYLIQLLGGKSIYFLADPLWFRTVLIISGIWQSVGWGSIIYLASIANIDIEMYEAAIIDGANRFQQAFHITVPMMYPVITVLLILSIGNILNAGFDQIFNLYTPLVYRVADIIDTYIYRRGLIESDYGFATAVGLFKNVIGFFLVIGTNFITKRISEYGVW